PDLMAESATSAPASLTQEDATIGAFEPSHRAGYPRRAAGSALWGMAHSACGGSGPTIATPPRLDPVVLIPCSAGSARQWKARAEKLPGFAPLPLDLWGHGTQDRWHGAGPLSLAEEAAAIHDACPDGTPFHVVGHSYGGGVALRFALSHPQRLRSL